MKFPNIKDDALRTALEELAEAAGKNVDVLARCDQLGKQGEQRDADVKSLRTQIDELKATVEKRAKEQTEFIQRSREEAMRREGIGDKRRGLEICGMAIRAALCRRFGAPIPEVFKAEAETLRAFQQRATLSADGGAGGGFSIPTITSSEMIDSLEEISTLLSLVDFRPGLPGQMDIPVLTGRPALLHKRASVDTNMTQSDASISQLQFRPDEGYIFMPVDNRWIQMSAIALGMIGFPLIQEGITQGLVNDLLNADGTASYNSITGAFQDATADYLTVLPAGKTAFADLTAADLLKAKANVLKRGRGPRGRWVMAQDVAHLALNMDRQGKVPVVTYDAQGNPLIFGNRVEVEELAPGIVDSAASKSFGLFGDLATLFVGMVDGIALDSSTDALFLRNQTALRGVINFDIKRKPVRALTALRTAAAA